MIPETGDAVLRVVRNEPNDIKLRDIQVYADGDHFADLRFGQSHQRTLSARTVELLLDNTLVKKRLTVELKPGVITTIKTANVASGCLWIFISLLGVGPYGMSVSVEHHRDTD